MFRFASPGYEVVLVLLIILHKGLVALRLFFCFDQQFMKLVVLVQGNEVSKLENTDIYVAHEVFRQRQFQKRGVVYSMNDHKYVELLDMNRSWFFPTMNKSHVNQIKFILVMDRRKKDINKLLSPLLLFIGW